MAVVGPGRSASDADCELARRLGRLISDSGWVLLTGGRSEGVMDAANRGAKENPSALTVGILPSDDERGTSPFVDVAVITGLGEARNNVNVLSARVVFACGLGPGTASEIALAIKAKRPVVLVRPEPQVRAFFMELGGSLVHEASSPEQAVKIARDWLPT